MFRPISDLSGVGPATADKLAKVARGPLLRDLLFHLPETYIDRSLRLTIATAQPGVVATLEVEVVRIDTPQRGTRQPWRVTVRDPSGVAEIAYFQVPPPREVKANARLMVSGRMEPFGDRLQIKAPRLVPLERAADLPALEPVWPLTARLTQPEVERAMAQALTILATLPEPLPEWHDPALLRREGWPGFADALKAVQAPNAAPSPEVRRRLAYDELLAHQVAMAWSRSRNRAREGRGTEGDGAMRHQALERFGHTPTPSQVHALAEIDRDMAAPRRMLRLLQGDVGSGKTLVAILAMLSAAEAGRQAALMAPTEVLAKQHLRTLSALSPIPVRLLTGNVKGVERRAVLLGLASGRLQIVVGTHALFQDAVTYRNLALAVIDEQHRFGVEQRGTLGAKGEMTDVLVMTATPIPRSLLLTQYGEMEVSRLTEKPAGRRPVRTTIHPLATLDKVVDAVARALTQGERVYWVCPMVSESETSDLAAAEARYVDLARRFGDAVGLAHGQQDPAVRDRALADFAAGRLRLLVATTVIEVGVDVPEASVMVIEHAERFGLAQLHQLRGRVGRGAAQSYCLLLHEDATSDAMRRRLTMLRDTEDGFLIADEDFRIRGGGDVLGKRQSGLPDYRLANGIDDQDRLLNIAARDAALLLDRDPGMTGPRAEAIRLLLRLFGRDDAMRALGAG